MGFCVSGANSELPFCGSVCGVLWRGNSLKGPIMAVKQSSFRVEKVRGDLRGKVWYLTYSEDGRRHRPRVGSDKDAAKQMAAQIRSQLEVGAPAAQSFEAVSLDELQARWLRHHEQVLRTSVQTTNRYRAAPLERGRNDFPICQHFGASALAWMILPSMILLNSDFAKSWRAKS